MPWALSGLESYLLLNYCLLRGDFSGLLFSLPREEAQPHPCFTSAAKSLWGDVLRIHGKIQENGIQMAGWGVTGYLGEGPSVRE